MLLELFDNILTNKANATKIKTTITEIYNKRTIFEDKKEVKMKDVNNTYETSNHNNLSIK